MKNHLVAFNVKFMFCTKSMISEVVINCALVYYDILYLREFLKIYLNKLFVFYRW